MFGVIAEKMGMTQIYDQDGAQIPVTVLKVRSNVITALKTVEKGGYSALQLGCGEVDEKRVKKPQRSYFKKNNLKVCNHLREFRVSGVEGVAVGVSFGADVFSVGDEVDVQGTSKGKGFQGVMKRWHFAGGADSHGCSVSHRVPGSIGQRAYPGRVFPGKKMPGQMGNRKSKAQNLRIVAVESEQGLLLVSGSVPGARGSRVYVYPHATDFIKRVSTATVPEIGSQTA